MKGERSKKGRKEREEVIRNRVGGVGSGGGGEGRPSKPLVHHA